jgi:hypothetical protein
MTQQIDSFVATLLTASEVAEVLRVTKKWVYDHADGRRRPRLPCYEISEGGRKTRRFSRKQIEEFLKECEKWTTR